MKLSDISNLKLSPGTYVITASFDGDDEYNPVEVQYILVITGSDGQGGQSGGESGGQEGGGSTRPRPIEDEDEGNVVATEPSISFSPSSVNIVETDLDEYPLRWTQFLKNGSNVSYTVEFSEGLIVDSVDRIGWDQSGTYTIRLTTIATKRFTSKTITLTLNITSKVNPQIEYTNNNGQFILEDGVLVKRYYNLEKREGVYMFDLIQPSNPFNLPLTYMIDETNDGSINVSSNKIYLSKEGKYIISAIFAGDKTYRASMTSYTIKFYEGEEPDEPEEYKTRQLPNLSFSTSQVAYLKRDDNKYEGIDVINPFNVKGIWSVSKGNITSDGKTITYDELGNVIVSYGFLGDDKYNKQTASYILNVYQDDNPNNLPMPEIGFSEERVEVNENDKHEYEIQKAYNKSGVNINYYYKNKKIDDMILKTTDIGELTITAISDENEAFARCTISYTLVINSLSKKDPDISFDQSEVTEYQTSNGQYLVQFPNNPNNLELKYESTNGYVEDGILHYDGLGNVVITAKFEGDFYFNSASISYVLTIKESNKKSPELSFDNSEIFMNCNDNNVYPIQPVNNPHNVDVRWSVDKGELDNEVNPQTLSINYSEHVNVYCKSVEDDTYKSEVVSYKLSIGVAKKYLDFEMHDDYDLYEEPGTFNLELLRYKKRQDLAFVASDWNITSSLYDCTIDDKYYTEDGEYIVVMVRLTFRRACNPLISITYVGNADFYTSSNMRIYVRLHGKNKQSPEISFASNYVIMSESTDFKYVLQEVNNPHEVEIVYSASAGQVDGNILTYYNDTWNVVVTATSIETDIYESQSITYVLRVEDIDKPSSGIHFPIDKIEIKQTEEGVYEIQDVVYANGDVIPQEELGDWGYYNSSSLGELKYDEDRQKWTITRPNWYGVIYVTFVIRETGQYKAEVVSYTLNILDGRKESPELAFESYWIKVDPNKEGKYPVQELINPHNVPIDRWYLDTTDSEAYLDDEHDPHWIYTPNKTYISVKVVSQETEEYSAQIQSYGMSINSGGNKDAELSFDNYDIYEVWNEEGIYTFQKVNNPHNVSPLTYNTEVGEIVNEDHIECKNLKKNTEFWVSVKFDGDVEYRAAFLRYWIHVNSKPVKRYKYEMCENVDIIGELNTDFEVDLFKYSTDCDDYEFNQKDWTITCGNQYLTCKELKSREVNGYIIVSGVFTCSWEYMIPVSVTYKGQYEDFVFEVTKDRTMYITFSVEHIEDPRIRPAISFSDYMYDVVKTDNHTYKLQTLNKPDDVEIDYWEIDYGGNGWENARIIDNEYVYYEGTDYIHIRVHTKEDEENYLAATDGYSMYVNEPSKWYAQISFLSESLSKYKNDEGIYDLQPLRNIHNVSPIIWSSDKGTLDVENGIIRYNDVGPIRITARFEGNDDYYEEEASYTLRIRDEYEKKNIDLTHCGIQEVVYDNTEQECEVRLGKYPISSGLTFNSSEWTLTSDYTWTYNLIKLYSIDEGDYRYIMGTFTFNESNRSVAYVLKFLGNERYNDNRTDSLLRFETVQIDKIDPKVSLPGPNPERIQRSDEEPRKYLIQKPQSEYPDVEFEDPTTPTQGATIVKEGDDFYAYYDGTSDIVINIKTKENPKYYRRTLTYNIDIYVYVDPRTHAPIMFGSDTYYVARRTDGTYANVCDFRNFRNLEVTLSSDKGTFDQDTLTLHYDGDGYVTITAIYPGDDDTYFYTEKTCTVIIQETYEKVNLNAQAYDSFHVEVEGHYNTEQDVCLLKWPTNELFVFDVDEWIISNQNTYSSTIYDLYVEEEGDYTVLKGKILYERDGSTVCTLYLKDNTYFYDGRWDVTIYFAYHAPEKIDPKISWPEPEPDKVPIAEKYLIQVPQSEYDDVEFEAPTTLTQGAIIEKEGDDYYVYFSGSSSLLIQVRNVASEKYYTKTISYYISIYVPTVLPEAPFNFGSDSYTRNRRTDGIYQPGDLRNYKNLELTWTSDKGTIDQNTGVLTYDGDGDVVITVIFEGNDDYRYTEKSYVLHIVNVYEKTRLNAQLYNSFHIEVEGEYDTEYDISLLKWTTNELFVFNSNEWTISNQSAYCDIDELYIDTEGDYTVLKGKITFTRTGSATITINFKNNEFFYDERYNPTIYFTYKETQSEEPDRIDPLISWPIQPQQIVKKNSENKYLVQVPHSEYDDVEFEKPKTSTSGAQISKISGQYYVIYSGIGDVYITCSNVETDTYMKSTIYYTLTIYDDNVEPGTNDKVDAPIYFQLDEVQQLINGSDTYTLQTLHNTENLEVEWTSSYGTIDLENNTIYIPNSDKTSIYIYVTYPGDERYKFTKIKYNLRLKTRITKEYLGASPYDYNTNLTVKLNKSYYVYLYRIDKSKYNNMFTFNRSEWRITNDYSWKCICQDIIAVEEDQYVYIIGDFIFKDSGYSIWTLNFNGNDYFYPNHWGGEIYFVRDTSVELKDPEISWPNPNPDMVSYNTTHLYLIQKPRSPFSDVEFEDITCSRGTIIKSGNDLYLSIEEDDVDITISVKNKASDKYSSQTISYVLKIDKSPIIKVDADIYFQNAIEEHDIVWSSTKVKKYKVQKLYNPNDVGVRFICDKGTLRQLDQKIFLEDGFIDYGYYILYDEYDSQHEYEDIRITVISQENEYYLSTRDEYMLRITNPARERVLLSFNQLSVVVTKNISGLYEIQDVNIDINDESDLQLITDSISYYPESGRGSIEIRNGKRYLKTSGTGRIKIYAGFGGNDDYRPAETYYTLSINERTYEEWPYYFEVRDIYAPSTDDVYYPLQQLKSDYGTPTAEIFALFSWNLTPGWTMYNGQLIAPNVITADTTVYIECTMPEAYQFAEKKIFYYLHIETDHRTRLGVQVNENLTFEEETVPVKKKIELLRWPTYQGYQYNENEWSIIEKDNAYNIHSYGTLLRRFITVESELGWYIMYLDATSNYCKFSQYYKYPIEITFLGTSNYFGPETWALEIEIKEPSEEPDDPGTGPGPGPGPGGGDTKVDPDTHFEQQYGINYRENISRKYQVPTIINNSGVVYHLYWQQVQLKSSVNTMNYYNKRDINNYDRIGLRTEITTDMYFDFEGYGTVVFDLWTESTDTYNSISQYRIGFIDKNSDLYQIDPTIYFVNQQDDGSVRIRIDKTNDNRYQLPEIYNPDGLTYKVYTFRSWESRQEVTLDENGYFTYPDEHNYFIVAVVTDETMHYYSKTLYAYYTLIVHDYNIFTQLNPMDDEDNDYPMFLHGKVNFEMDYIPTTPDPPVSGHYYIHDELNYYVEGSYHNVHRFIKWNKDAYVFDPDDWEIEIPWSGDYINIVTRNMRGDGSYEPYFRTHSEDAYCKIQYITIDDQSYLIPYIGFTRTPEIDGWTSSSKTNYDVYVTHVCYISFKGKKDENDRYIQGLEPREWIFELMYRYVDFNNTPNLLYKNAPNTYKSIMTPDSQYVNVEIKREELRYRLRRVDNFDNDIVTIPYYKSGMTYQLLSSYPNNLSNTVYI